MAAVGTPAIEYSTTLIWLEVIIGEPAQEVAGAAHQFGDATSAYSTGRTVRRPVDSFIPLENPICSFALPFASGKFEFSWLPEDVLVVATDGIISSWTGTKVGDYLARSVATGLNRWISKRCGV